MVEIAVRHLRVYDSRRNAWILPLGATQCWYQIEICGRAVAIDVKILDENEPALTRWSRVTARAVEMLRAEGAAAAAASERVANGQIRIVNEIPIITSSATGAAWNTVFMRVAPDLSK